MKTAALTGLRRVEIRNAPDPRPARPDEVLLKMGAIGICGSDVHYYAEGRIGSQVVEYPFLLGHECAGTVVETGSAVSRFRPGDRVVVDPAMPCRACDQCLAGREHTCRRLRFLGCPGQAEGCLGEYLVMPEGSLFAAPELSLEQAAMIEPLSIGLYTYRMAGLKPGAAIAILGCGPIGLSVLLSARAEGVGRVYTADPLAYRAELAGRHGADWTADPGDPAFEAGVNEREPLLLDAVFECCGRQEALDQGVRLLKPGGTLVIVGIPAVDRVSFCMDTLRRRELAIRNVRRQNLCVEPAIEAVRAGRIVPDFMVTHRYPLDRAAEAIEQVAAYRDGVVKAMIEL